jgi:F420-dependent oxidoreductase-like protein
VSIPIGIAVAPPAPDVPNAIDDLISRFRDIAATGVASLWLGQLFDLDAITAIAVVGREVPDVELGTAVSTTYPRHPIVMSSQAQTTQSAIGGRLRLGLGVSHREIVEDRLGYSFERPARHLREYLEVLNGLFENAEVDFHGAATVADTRGFPGHVPGSTRPDVLIAALGPAMLRVTGELADGTITWLAGPRTLAEHIVPILTKAAEGRARPKVIASLPVCVTNRPDDVLERARAHLAMYDQFAAYTAVLKREGADRAGDVAIVGDEAHVEKAINGLRDAGATEFIGNAWGFTTEEEHDRTVALLGSLSEPGVNRAHSSTAPAEPPRAGFGS